MSFVSLSSVIDGFFVIKIPSMGKQVFCHECPYISLASHACLPSLQMQQFFLFALWPNVLDSESANQNWHWKLAKILVEFWLVSEPTRADIEIHPIFDEFWLASQLTKVDNFSTNFGWVLASKSANQNWHNLFLPILGKNLVSKTS